MNKKFNKDPYDLKPGDKVLLQKFFSSKHLSFTKFHKEKVGKLATFLGFEGYRDRQAIIELRDGLKLHWRTESLKYVKQHTKDEVEDIIGHGRLEINEHGNVVNLSASTDNSVESNRVYRRSVEYPISPSEAYSTISLNNSKFPNIIITEEEAVKIIKDPQSFIKDLEKKLEDATGFPEFDRLVDITNPYDILKELVRLRDIFNSTPGSGFEYIISFEENNTNHKIVTVNLKNFNRSIFTFNSKNKADIFLSKYGEYLKIISRVFF